MVKLRAKNLLALALSILMLTGTVTDWLPTALAVAEPSAVTEQPVEQLETQDAQLSAADQPETQAVSASYLQTLARSARYPDFQEPDNGRPNLYVDFLGDNIGNGTAENPGVLVAPAAYNKDKRTNYISENSWEGYSGDDVNDPTRNGDILFWIGVGIDRVQVWELLRNSGNKGLTSLELGFYYNDTYIEPYVAGNDYAATIANANINGPYTHNQWGENYHIVHAETDLPVEDGDILRADPITQDVMENPSLDNIRNNRYSDNDLEEADADWRMTYISLELESDDLARRLAGEYTGYKKDGNGEVIVPDEASGTDTDDPANVPVYLMMIPFRVKRYDAQGRLCLRLIRDASHFSVGAGNDGVGDAAEGSYAAWERVTIRNTRTNRIRIGRAWSGSDSSLMALLADATSQSDLANRLGVLELQEADILGDGAYVGLRKNLSGDLYEEEDLADAAARLWALRALVLADTAAGGLKEQYYKASADNTYHYFDLTPAQVQAYLVTCLEEGKAPTTVPTASAAITAMRTAATIRYHWSGENDGKTMDLKLQLRFAGDLNIWRITGDSYRTPDVFHRATLLIQNGGGSENTARLSVQSDKGANPVYVDVDRQFISNLQGGTGMEVHLTVQAGYEASIWVYYESTEMGEDGNPLQMGWPYTTVTNEERDKHYTFVMPNEHVFVRVIFKPGNTRDYILYLSEIPKPYEEDYMLGNETYISSFCYHDPSPDDGDDAVPTLEPVSINSFDPRGSHPTTDSHGPGPKMIVSKNEIVTVDVYTHPDYEAWVHVFIFGSGENLDEFISMPADATRYAGDPTILILPQSGTITFKMTESDMDVVVEYRRADTKKAMLEVWHVGDAADADKVKDVNIAQLAYLSYNDQAAVSTAYSGQVYEQVDPNGTGDDSERYHSAVKDPSYKTTWVPYSASTVSKSLGGDTGRTGHAWTGSAAALMTALSNATDVNDLINRFNALDLLNADLLGDGSYMGLRKNLDGEIYGDDELRDVAALLWELRSKILADPTASGNYYKESNDKTYHYFALTPAQVQAYRIACLEVDAIFRANQKKYRDVYKTYQEIKQVYDAVHKVSSTSDAAEPIPPLEPLRQVIYATGRTYQGTDYIDDYIASYDRYMKKYDTYITSLRDGTSSNTDFPEEDEPSGLPNPVEVELPDAATALNTVQTAIDTYGWGDNEVDAPSAEVETTAAVATRSGRTVWLLVEADAGYEVEGVRLLDKDSRVELRDVAVASTSFKNVYTFSMPEVDCIVQVRYKLRERRPLWWQVIGANGKEDNVAVIEAYQITAYDTAADLPSTDEQWDSVYPTLPTGSTGTYATLASTTEPLDPTRPTLARRTNKDHEGESPYPDDDNMTTGGFPVEGVLAKSQVTIRTTCDKDYKVTVSASNGLGGGEIYVTSNDATGIHTFTVPSDHTEEVVVTITYAPKDESIQTAYIHVVGYDGAYADTNYSGVWTNENLNQSIITAMSDTELHGAISLAEGFYIYASYAVGEHGTYPYTLDGNGYNNGLGAGNLSTGASRAPVRLETVMPNEDLHVYIVVRKGLPPDEPANALTVIVVDDDNKDSPVADNWARATVHAREDDAERVILSAAGKGATGGGTLQVTHYGKVEDNTAVMAGDRVELELSATTGFYIAEVALQPSYLGGDLEWLTVPDQTFDAGGRKLQFTMPAGSTTVTVRFRKMDESITSELPSYYVHAQRIETDRNGALVSTEYDKTNLRNNNRITTATSGTIQGYAPGGIYTLTSENQASPEQVPSSESGRGAGVAGETVTMTFQVKPGWYVQSVAVMTDGSARPVDYQLVPGSGNNEGAGGEFTANIVMPAGDASFIVKYRQCPADDQSRPEIPEYAITLMVIDDDNIADPADDNRVTASFAGVNESTHSSIQVNHYTTNAIQYIHAGDQVELHHNLVPGYSMDYMIVNPTELGLVPTYVSPDTARFTMPARNITVVAKIVKKPQQKYTADLILHPPAGMDVEDLSFVGQGTFTNEVDGVKGSLTGYYANAIYSLLLVPGEKVDFDLYAFDGYYIRAVTVEPAKGAEPSLTGSFSRQSGGFVMPAANSYVNVYFEKLWPDQVKYDLTLKVNDSSGKDNNYAYFDTYGGVDFSTNDRKPVHGGETLTVRATVLDGEEVYVALNREDGYYYDPASIQVTDSSGAEISWRMTAWRKDKTSVNVDAVGIAFLMPPRSTTVEITYRKDNRPQDNVRTAVLHIVGGTVDPEIIRLYRNDGTQSGDFAWSNGGSIEDLHPGDLLHVRVEDLGPNRRVAAAYAFDEATGEQLMLPMTLVPDGGRDSFLVPTLPAGVDATGKDIHVYVIMETRTEGDLSQTMNLVVQGPQGSGAATLFETEDTANSVTVTAGATGSPTEESPVGHINAAQGSALTVTMNPASGYYISQLTVTDNQGAQVSYEWISMVENDDTDPSTWEPNPDRQITLLMPATGGTVQVTYAKIPTDDTDPENPKPKQYTAQVVVNNDQYDGIEPSPNNATLSNQALGQGPDKLVTAEAGQWVDLDITVKAGYRIELVFVSPQSFGIKPQLPLGDLDSQTTGFYMPAGDVTVYVKFVRDDQRVFNAYLRVDKDSYRGEVDENGLGANHADIYSERTGLRGPIDCTDNDVMVQAAANREWVTVTYDWGEDSWVSGLTVKDGANQNVPFTQVDEHTITLPMVARDVIITLFYEKGEPPEEPVTPSPAMTPVRLHVIDMTDGTIDLQEEGWARVIHNGEDPDTEPAYTDGYTIAPIKGDGSTGEVRIIQNDDGTPLTALPIADGQTDAEWGNTKTIWMPAGRTATLEAFSNQADGVYIHSAYVLYRDGGQMIDCNLQPNQVDPDTDEGHTQSPDHGFYWHRSATFRAHPDYNDVYVFLTTERREADEYAATLMLKSPTGDIGSAAAIWTWDEDADDFKEWAGVKANGDHGRITAKRKETVKVTVTPMEGYDVDYILMTPLGIPITPKLDKNGNYTFTMPGYNVNVCVYLKRNNKRTFDARIHYTQQWDPDTDPVGEHNEGVIWWDKDETTRVSAKANRQTLPNSTESVMKVDENETVTLDITLDDPYVVLAAYVLQGGAIVPLSASLEGTKENRSMVDNSLPDGTAQFTMPSGNVDVFVVTTTTPPTGVWHTAVLTVQDPDNSGDCEATIERPEDYTANYLPDPRYETAYSVPPTANHKFISVREGQTVTVSVAEDTTGKYTFDRPPLLTHSATYGANLNPVSSSATQYVYQFTVGPCNSAVLVNFKKKEAETRPLTVVIEDPDNPGNNTVSQTATVTAGSLAPLTLTSVSSLGAYQVISGVEDGSAVTVRAVAHEGYKAYAYWSYGTTRERVILTQTGNVYTGAVSMPPQAAQLTITYYKAWEATVTIYDPARSASQAQMGAEVPADITFPDGTRNYVSVGAVTVSPAVGQMNSASISDLDTGTRLTTAVTPAGNSRVVAVLATDANGTRFLTDDDGNYVCTVDKSDMDVAVIMGAEDDGHYVASVVTRGKPASAADPAIAVSSNPVSFGSIWSVADAGDTVTVTVPPVDGYRVTVTTNDPAVTVTAGAGNTYTATMPAANLQFTVTYEKEPTLTLRVLEPESTKTLDPRNDTLVTGGAVDLTEDGKTTSAVKDNKITVTATPSDKTVQVTDIKGGVHDCPVVVKEITYRTPTNTYVLYTNSGSETGAVTKEFFMPDGDVTVVVRYGLKLPDGVTPNIPDDEEDYYTAWVETAGDDGQPENRVNAIWNVTKPGAYPTGTPDWACGAPNNEMKLSISVKDGYYVTVTAETRKPDGSRKTTVPVIQQGDTGLCTASVTMPGEDVFITVTYDKIENKPENEKEVQVTLVLVGHGGLLGNSAEVTGGSLTDLAASGQTVNHLGNGDRVYAISGTAKVGDELRLSANWAGSYQITRATLSLPKDASVTIPSTNDAMLPDSGDYVSTGLALSEYGTNKTARVTLPAEGAVITVYYSNIFQATLHIEPHGVDYQDVNGNQTSATDGSATIDRHLDRLENLGGGETIATTAKPGPGQRLVGVVYESATEGATAATLNKTVPDRYDFTMPQENVDFYAVYESANENSYIAKVRFDGTDHLGDSGNAVTITNTSDSAAPKGKYWTAAKEGNAVVINVKVAEGYKAEIITTYKDNADDHADDGYDFYISRVNFLPNLTLGKDATFSMPADTDATVTIRFTKGYDLALEVVDVSHITGGRNQADVNIGSLHGESDGTNITYTPAAAVETDSSGTERVVTHGVEGGTTTVKTDVTPASNDVPYKVYRRSLFTGTTRVDLPTGTPPTQPTSPYYYEMPSADVLETVLFYNDEAPLLAKVEVKGESDINGNSATPIIDYTDTVSATPKTTTGTVWTTTADGNTIDLTITVAQGYIAKVKVRRDNDLYYGHPDDESWWEFLKAPEEYSNFQYETPDGFKEMVGDTEVQFGFQDGAGPFGDYISDAQHFRFEMPSASNANTAPVTDVTVIVEFVFAGVMPQPFDPDNPAMDNIDLDRGFIYGENLGDFALIDIPTLYQDQKLFNTDNYNKTDPNDSKSKVKFNFFLYNAGKDEYTPLVLGVDVLLEPEDEKTLLKPTDPYNYYRYETNLADDNDFLDDDDTREETRPYTGSRFKLVPTEADELTGNRTDGAQALYDILNNNSSLARDENDALATNSEGKYYTTLYVMAEDAIGQKSAYTQVWIRPHFTVEVQVISYAPTHTTTANLYRLLEQDEDATPDPDWGREIEHYRLNEDDKPYLSNYTAYDGPVVGAGKYYQKVGVMSSELLGSYGAGYDPGANLLTNVLPDVTAVYALTLEKASSLTYTRVNLDLLKDVDTTTGTAPIHYNANTLTYTVLDLIYLITGDVDGNGYTKWQDYDTVYTYVFRNIPWNNTQTEAPDLADPNYATLQARWLLSTYNPDSMAYRCDLNGDRVLTYQDVELVQTIFDYNRSVEDYLWTEFEMVDGKKVYGEKVLPFGFGGDKSNYITLFALDEPEDAFPVEPDAYWDALMDPGATEAPPLNNPYVDENGELWYEWAPPEVEQTDETPSSPSRDTGGNRRDDALMEVPVGDEVMERPGAFIDLPAFDPGPAVELPAFDPEWDTDLPDPDPDPVPEPDLHHPDDNGPGEVLAETPADITTEE